MSIFIFSCKWSEKKNSKLRNLLRLVENIIITQTNQLSVTLLGVIKKDGYLSVQ